MVAQVVLKDFIVKGVPKYMPDLKCFPTKIEYLNKFDLVEYFNVLSKRHLLLYQNPHSTLYQIKSLKSERSKAIPTSAMHVELKMMWKLSSTFYVA